MSWLRGIGSVIVVGSLVAACGAGQPSDAYVGSEDLGSSSAAITAACNLNTIGLPCDPDGPAKPKLECEGVCAIGSNGLVACQAVTVGSLDGVICGTTGGVGDAACGRYCSGKTCRLGAAPEGAACRPNSKATPCDGSCDGAGKCQNLGASACAFGRDEQLCTFATCKFTDSTQCLTANLPRYTFCSDADACSISKCDGKGKCLAGGTVGCDDGNACTDDSCDSEDGGCIGVPDDDNTCSDGNACTTGDHCDAGGCVPGNVQTDCNDNLVCTTDTCDPNTGCAHLPKCADADACTEDVCDEAGGGACTHPAKVCDDADPCTTDACDSGSGCVFVPLSCDDDDSCTIDSCSAGACVHESDPQGCGQAGAGGMGEGGAPGSAGAAGADDGMPDGGEPTSGGSSSGSSGTGGTASGGVAGSSKGGAESGGPSVAGKSATAGTSAEGGDGSLPSDGSNTSSGCGCRVATSQSSGSGIASVLALLGLSLLRRRR